MNDRFRCRAWNKEDESYAYEIQRFGSFYPNPYWQDSFADFLDDDDWIIEQCTGLKDKNGKFIYEGDIIREISKKEPEWEEYITAVRWKECGFNLYDSEDFDFEIIGNIHENGDLVV